MSVVIIFVKEVAVGGGQMPIGRRDRAKQDKHERIMTAARDLFAEQGVSGVTTQQIADRADVAIGTLYRYASTKARLLIMVQNETSMPHDPAAGRWPRFRRRP